MSKHIELLDDLKDYNKDTLISLVGNLLTVTENVAYAYDITDQYCEDVSDCLDYYDINYQIVDEDI